MLPKLNQVSSHNMITLSSIKEFQAWRKSISQQSIGFIPTMGNLHDGHLSLCERSKQENDITVVSIFVNPTQFNQSSDFDLYPRTIAKDLNLLIEYADCVFLPSADSMYADNYQIKIIENDLSKEFEGEYRPGHFTGMLTVVLKLLNLVYPTKAYFGEKDYQQLLLIKKMVSSLFLPIDIIACETVRAEDGLALSSRNSRLNQQQRAHAAHFPASLKKAKTAEDAKIQLEKLGFKIDYIVDKWERRLGAVWLDDVRLIDNVFIENVSDTRLRRCN